MTYRNIRVILLVGAAALGLTACGGGGGGGGVASTPPPPTTPTPTPTPTPAPVVIFPNVTASTQFATLGYESGHPISAGSLVGTGFSVSYDAQSNSYVMDVPASQPGRFLANSTGDRYWGGTLESSASGGEQPIGLHVFRPGTQNWDFPGLTYTSFAEYSTTSGQIGDMAFGLPTPASGVPVTGSATYAAFAAGYLAGATEDIAIRGSATLQFNFGAGTLAGSFDPYIYDLLAGNSSLGHYDFVNTVFGVGSTSFSGELSRSGLAQHGTFNGLFTGPNAQELMARWTAPFPGPNNTTSQMFGVWVGKKP